MGRTSPIDRAPKRAWARVFALSLGTALWMLAALEVGFRALGFQPSVTDSAALLGREYRRAVEHGGIALVGSSRFQLGLDPDRISEGMGGCSVANLSVTGRSGLPHFVRLANETDFSGVAIVEFIPARIYTPDYEDIAAAEQEIARVEALAAYSDVETTLRLSLQSKLALLNPEIRLAKFVGWVVSGQVPVPVTVYREHRLAEHDFSRLTPDQSKRIRKWQLRQHLGGERLKARLELLHDATRRIQSRGGTVVFFRIHASGPTRDAEERLYPREAHWDRFVVDSPAICIHFEDMAGALELPDGSHADRSQIHQLTDMLVHALAERDVSCSTDRAATTK